MAVIQLTGVSTVVDLETGLSTKMQSDSAGANVSTYQSLILTEARY